MSVCVLYVAMYFETMSKPHSGMAFISTKVRHTRVALPVALTSVNDEIYSSTVEKTNTRESDSDVNNCRMQALSIRFSTSTQNLCSSVVADKRYGNQS